MRSTLRIVFDRIEHENNPAPVDLSSLSVEHLMPQTPTKEWLEMLGVDLDTYQKNLHRLGNLTLAAKTDNSAMGNKGWSYKNEVLKSTSHLKMNEEVLKVEQWDIDEIEKRTVQLINKINVLYPYPVVNDEIIPKEEIFIKTNGITAKGYLSLDDGSVEIDVGSQLFKFDNSEHYAEIEELRQELFEDGIIADIDGSLQFVKPYIIYTKVANSTALSSAANIILHGSRNGWEYWENAEGVALNEVPGLRERFI